jgi:hypothetical protein
VDSKPLLSVRDIFRLSHQARQSDAVLGLSFKIVHELH